MRNGKHYLHVGAVLIHIRSLVSRRATTDLFGLTFVADIRIDNYHTEVYSTISYIIDLVRDCYSTLFADGQPNFA